MKVKHSIALILAASLASMALTYWYVKSGSATTESFATSETRPTAPPVITTALPARRTFTLHVHWIGTVESRASIDLTALIPGRVAVIEAEDQTQVEQDHVVVRLGGPRVEEVRARLAAQIQSLGSRIDIGRKTLQRLRQSLKTQLATKDQVAAAQDAQVKLESQLREVRLSLKTFESQIRLSAPMTGVFTNRRVSVGQAVIAGQVVGEIIDTGRLRIAASIFPPQGMELSGKKAIIQLHGNQTLSGLIRRVLPRASSTGAATVWIEGPQIDARLHPGETVSGRIIAQIRPDALAVPESAIVYDSREHPYLFVRKGSSYEPLSIQLGLVQDGWVQVLSGLKRDRVVVTQGAYELFYRQFNEQFKVQD